jgi:hypothetical protein
VERGCDAILPDALQGRREVVRTRRTKRWAWAAASRPRRGAYGQRAGTLRGMRASALRGCRPERIRDARRGRAVQRLARRGGERRRGGDGDPPCSRHSAPLSIAQRSARGPCTRSDLAKYFGFALCRRLLKTRPHQAQTHARIRRALARSMPGWRTTRHDSPVPVFEEARIRPFT